MKTSLLALTLVTGLSGLGLLSSGNEAYAERNKDFVYGTVVNVQGHQVSVDYTAQHPGADVIVDTETPYDYKVGDSVKVNVHQSWTKSLPAQTYEGINKVVLGRVKEVKDNIFTVSYNKGKNTVFVVSSDKDYKVGDYVSVDNDNWTKSMIPYADGSGNKFMKIY